MANWTEQSANHFVYKIASDFILQLEKKMETEPLSQKALASKLGVSVGRVSQILNNPGNFTLKKIVQYARALDMKVSVVAYDDNDPTNQNGPINSEIFQICWENAGRPTDFFGLSSGDYIVGTFRIKSGDGASDANMDAQIVRAMKSEIIVPTGAGTTTEKEQAYA